MPFGTRHWDVDTHNAEWKSDGFNFFQFVSFVCTSAYLAPRKTLRPHAAASQVKCRRSTRVATSVGLFAAADGRYRQKGTCRVMSCHRGAWCLSRCVTTSSSSNRDSLFPINLSADSCGVRVWQSICSFVSSVVPLHPLLLARQPGLSHLLQGLARVHDEGQRHGGRAVAALPGEAEEGGPEEGAAAHEGRSHVGRHQDEVQELRGQRLANHSSHNMVFQISTAQQDFYTAARNDIPAWMASTWAQSERERGQKVTGSAVIFLHYSIA